MKQLELAKVAIKNSDYALAREVLGRAQNRPPLGESDGSMTEAQWYALRDYLDACDLAKDAMLVAKRALGIEDIL